MRTGARRVGLPKPFKNVRKKLRFDSFTGVRHRDFDVVVNALQADLHVPSSRREFDRVGQKVPDDLVKPIGIPGN